jgi:hypothetical protein
MASSVYVETTIVSYLTARPSRDLVQERTSNSPDVVALIHRLRREPR